jgi:general L-amino acid transport system substrate-binding protein
VKARGILVAASCLVVLVLSLGTASGQATATNRLADIEARGTVNCGIWPYVPGFAVARNGRYVGFDVDICRAVAAAILGDAKKVRFVTLASIKQFAQHKEVDLAIRRLTWMLSRESANGVAFGPVTFYDGLGLLVSRRSGIERAAQLAGARICVMSGGDSHPEALVEYFRSMGHDIELVVVGSDKEAEESIRSKRCVAYSADISWLAAARSTFEDGATRFNILSDEIAKEPLAPMVRAEDTELLQVLRWTIFAMIEAEELGLSSRNVNSGTPISSRARSFLAIHPGSRVVLGAGEWARTIVAEVGNYGEVFDRNLGAGSAIKLDRGFNRLWTHGGLIYAPPMER